MATFFAPTPQYKAPTFQELAAPLEIYRQAYNSMEEKYDAQKEKAAMLQAMLGTDPDNELSQYMADYNALMDQTARGFSNGSLPYAQLYSNYQKLRDIWNDKGLKATAAIDSYTKYREAKSKVPGAIGPEYTLTDFLKRGSTLPYTFFNPEDIYKAGALIGAAYAQQRGPRNGRAIDNGRWVDEYGPTNEEISGAFSDSNNPFYADASNIMKQYGMDGLDENSRNVFMNAYQRGLASAQKFAVSNNVDYVTRKQRISNARASSAGTRAVQYADIDINNLPDGYQIVNTFKTPPNTVVINQTGTKNYILYDTIHHTYQVMPLSKLPLLKPDNEDKEESEASENAYFYERNNSIVKDANGNPHRVLYSQKLKKFGYLDGSKFYPLKKEFTDKHGYALSSNRYTPSNYNEVAETPSINS